MGGDVFRFPSILFHLWTPPKSCGQVELFKKQNNNTKDWDCPVFKENVNSVTTEELYLGTFTNTVI